ncbi:pimeloyl-ACP methyl ester carboxylesterase [Rhodococcus sp. AG1013]|uniref:alpha/beta fold hydrolase n=1 Tax=Rhodococcus sp. AG1013 TaxID=2183996 RepID=UPI000E0C0777|nr:alpha/beta hydrolase [Rhodococcus sp. AG1013]RDI12057.1 pimeloyl-ACP methyl ester carboxylesterase [Rhodococcus sp. AG1013]
MSDEQAQTPRWFLDALAAPVETGSVDVDGAKVRFRAWGEAGRPGIVLVHGGAAHSRWWDHIGPQLAGDRRVVALDMSGHGDSGTREQYSLDLWADEVAAVAGASGIEGRPVVVGHSMGGIVAFVAAHLHGDRLAGVQIIDSPIRQRTPEEEAARRKAAFGPKKVYADRGEALSRFRFVPPQDTGVPGVREHVAETSLTAVEGGWSWKFDPAVFTRSGGNTLAVAQPRCPIAYFRAEHGIVSPELMAEMRERFGPSAIVAEIPDAGHHAMIDQPLALVTGIRTVLSAWAASA